MRKVYMLLAVLGAFLYAGTANAGTKNLYKQDFESTTDPAAAGWVSPNLAAGMSIQGDQWGSYFVFNVGGNNGRSCYNLWGSDIYTDQIGEDGLYHMEFSWCYSANANNQYSTEVTVVSDEAIAVNNGSYVGKEGSQWLFDLRQLDADCNFAINNDETNTMIVTVGTWYVISLDVNVNARTVEWKIADSFGETVFAEGVREVPEEMSMLATGINNLNSRYYSEVRYDDIKVQVFTDQDFANPPSIALVGVNDNERTYSITFLEEEELHIKGTDGNEEVIYYMDCDGNYSYVTTTSGVLEAWTVSGTAESEHVSTEVDCSIISLPGAMATISSVEEGFGKTFTLTVSNADIPTQPTLYLAYKFINEAGVTEIEAEDRFSGEQVTVSSKGRLEVTTIAPGFQSTTVTIDNDTEFSVLSVIDFQHMTPEEITDKGFEEIDPLDSESTSGESNWTGRKRFNFNIETGEYDEDGNPILENVVVYGPSSQGYEPIRRFKFYQSKLDSIAGHTLFAPLYTWYYNDGVTATSMSEDGTPAVDANGNLGGTTNVQMKLGIGLVHSGVQGDAENYDPAGVGYGNIRINNTTLGVDGLTDSDFIVVNKINNYGSTSVHPTFPVGTTHEDGIAQYKAMNLGGISEVYTGLQTFQLYRVDTSITRVQVFREKGGNGIEEIVSDKVVSDPNAPVYNLNGVRVNPSAMQPGIYVKQGKKFIVR